jgi:hypothetical protein
VKIYWLLEVAIVSPTSRFAVREVGWVTWVSDGGDRCNEGSESEESSSELHVCFDELLEMSVAEKIGSWKWRYLYCFHGLLYPPVLPMDDRGLSRGKRHVCVRKF